jgi:hypothetical protein
MDTVHGPQFPKKKKPRCRLSGQKGANDLPWRREAILKLLHKGRPRGIILG